MIIPPAIHNDCCESVSNPADFITDEKKLPGAKSRRVSPYKMTSIIIAHKNWKSKGKKAEIFWKQSGKKVEANRNGSGKKLERNRKLNIRSVAICPIEPNGRRSCRHRCRSAPLYRLISATKFRVFSHTRSESREMKSERAVHRTPCSQRVSAP